MVCGGVFWGSTLRQWLMFIAVILKPDVLAPKRQAQPDVIFMHTFHISHPDADTLTSNEVKKPFLSSSMNFGKTELSKSFRKVVCSRTCNKFGSTIQPKFNQHSTQTPDISSRPQGYLCTHPRIYVKYHHTHTQKL